MTSLRMRASLVSTLLFFFFNVTGASAQDFFDDLFGGGESVRSAPSRVRSRDYYRGAQSGAYRGGGVRRHKETRASQGDDEGRAEAAGDPKGSEPGAGAGGEFCVRACDGYFFPLIRSAQATKQESCAYACPSASVEYFHGGSIDSARNLRGQRYSELPNAFKYREQTVPGCACHPPEASQQTSLRIAQKDPTAQSGDIVVENGGAFVFNGKRIVPIEGSHQVSASVRRDVRRMTEGPARAGFAAVVAPHPVAPPARASSGSELPQPSATVARADSQQAVEAQGGSPSSLSLIARGPAVSSQPEADEGGAFFAILLAALASAVIFLKRHTLTPHLRRAIGKLRLFTSPGARGARTPVVENPASAWVWSIYRGVIETSGDDGAGVETQPEVEETPPLAWVWSAYRGETIAEDPAPMSGPALARQEAPRKEPAGLYGAAHVAAA